MKSKACVAWVAVVLSLSGCRTRSTEEEAARPVEVEAAPESVASEPKDSDSSAAASVAAAPGQPDPRVVYRVPLDGTEPQRGPDDALMTIVEFGDFQCPFCAEAEPIMAEILERYGDDVRIVWLNFPQVGHRNARPAANAALEAQAQKGDAAFWEMHDKLFATPRASDRGALERYARELGLDMNAFRHALDTDKYGPVIDRQSELAQRLGVPGTPSWYMNGRFMAGFPFQTWAFTIDRRIGSVRRAVEQGVPRDELYDRIIAEGKVRP